MATATENPLAESADTRKAAILFRSLDPQSAAALIAQLSADEARTLRDAVRGLGEIDVDERVAVAADLKSTAAAVVSDEPTGGVALELSGGAELAEALAEQAAEHTVSAATAAVGTGAFPEIESADPVTLAEYLSSETTAVIAVVLSHLPAEKAAAVLSELPFAVRVDAIERLANLGEGDEQSLKALATGIGTWVAQRQGERQRQATRMEAINAILAATDVEGRGGLIDELRQRGQPWAATLETEDAVDDASLEEQPGTESAAPSSVAESLQAAAEATAIEEGEADQIANDPLPVYDAPTPVAQRPLSVPFEAVDRLPASLLAEVLKRTPSRQLFLAIAGGAESLQTRIESLLPIRRRREIRQRLTSLGPTTLREIEQAQHEVATVASDIWDFYHRPSAA